MKKNSTTTVVGALCFGALIVAVAMHIISWLIKLFGGTPNWGILSALVMIVLYIAVAYQAFFFVSRKSVGWKIVYWVSLAVALLLIVLPLAGVSFFAL